MPPTLCLYIPCRNGSAFLPEVFQAIATQTIQPALLLLVDDQSTDGTAALARGAGWTVATTIPDRCGLAAARNTALATAHAAGCDVIAGIDADAVPCADYVANLARFFEDHPQVSGLCGNMRERFSDTPSDLWRAVQMRQHWGDQPIDNPPILYGSSAAHRIAAVRQLGGFNETLRTNFEDTDLTQRLLAANHRLAYLPTLRLEHLKRDTPDSVLRMFWNWYLPPAVLAGQFASVDAWLRGRHPWIWSDYRSRSCLDDTYPTLSLLTLALPWIQVTRDMGLLAKRLGTPVDAAPLGDLAGRMLRERGHAAPIANWLAEWIRHTAAERAAPGAGPLNPVILEAVATEASLSLPRRSFWSHAERSAQLLGILATPG